jgi:uncharacterized BrkB/YihY/UPF0761 family membrane protein
MTETPAITATAPAAKPPVAVWDVILTIALIVVGSGITWVLVIFGALLGFAGDGCQDITCSFSQIGIGIIVAIFAPIVLFLIAIVLSIVRLVQRRRAFWVPLVGIVVAILGWVVGFLLVSTAVDGFYA